MHVGNSPQPTSSLLSAQSLSRLHWRDKGTQLPFEHPNLSLEH